MDAMQISVSGMDVEWRRLEVIAQNLANLNTTRTASGEPYRAMRLVSGPRAGFDDYLDAARNGAANDGRVSVYNVETSNDPPRLVYDPGHPHADTAGYVAYPNVDHGGEMARMLQTARVYEANIVALNTARQMYARALELGRR